MIFSDECYSEIYFGEKPAGMLEVAGPDYANVVVFNSLSKRSNLPGLRVGFVAGDRSFLARFLELPQQLGAAGADAGSRKSRSRRYDDEDACDRKPHGSMRRNSISPTRSSATATATSARPAASSCGSMSRRRAAA